MRLIPISLCSSAKQKTDLVPQVHGTLLLFVLSETVLSESILSSHKISQVSLQRKRENITTVELNVGTC